MPRGKPTYTIPEFSRYEVRLPFQVWDMQTGNQVAIVESKRSRFMHLYHDNGKRCTLSIATVAALAFWGYAPTDNQYMGYHYGGPIEPRTIRWLPLSEFYSRHKSKLSPGDINRILTLWETTSLTQREIASRFDVTQATISRIVSQRYKAYQQRKAEP